MKFNKGMGILYGCITLFMLAFSLYLILMNQLLLGILSSIYLLYAQEEFHFYFNLDMNERIRND